MHFRDFDASDQDAGKTHVVLETSAHWHDVVAFYLACGFRITHHTDGDLGPDTWFEHRL